MNQVNLAHNPVTTTPGTTPTHDTALTKQPTAGKEQAVMEKASLADVDQVSLTEAVTEINNTLYELRRDERQFMVDDDLGKLVVKIINSDTRELVRQIPTEEALSLSKKFQEISGLLFG